MAEGRLGLEDVGHCVPLKAPAGAAAGTSAEDGCCIPLRPRAGMAGADPGWK